MVNFYLVGGAIRDRLLGFEPAERDWVVVGATPEELDALGFRRLDAEFPVFAHPKSGEEYALARRERKTGPGHKGFVVDFGPDVTLEEDLQRRDLRLNAIAESESGHLVDPYGGIDDIESRTLRHVSPAFVEDPLRVLRAARFAARFDALGFSIHPSTLELMRTMCSDGEMGALSPARIWHETDKALDCDRPSRYFSVLAECGALRFLLPETCLGKQTAESASTTRRMVLASLEAAALLDGRAEVRFAALASALGNCLGCKIIDKICARYPVTRKYADLARVACRLQHDISVATPVLAASLLTALENADAFRRGQRFEDALLVCQALESSGQGGKAGVLERAYAAARAVTGADVSRTGLLGGDIAREISHRRLLAIEDALATGGTG